MRLTTHLRKFFLFCAGAAPNIINQCPDSEATKYVGIGTSVFFTSFFAFVSMSYALYRVFGDSLRGILSSFVLGLAWSSFIFAFDRWMVSSMRQKRQAIIRIFFATLVALVISAPIEVRLFSAQIARQLLSTRQKEMLADQSFYKSYYSVNSLQSEEEKARSTMNAAVRQMWADPPGPLFQNDLRNLHIAEADQHRIDIYAARELPLLFDQFRAVRDRIDNIHRQLRQVGLQSSAALRRTRDALVRERASVESRIGRIRADRREVSSRLLAAQTAVGDLRREYHNQLAADTANLRSRIAYLHRASVNAEKRAAAGVQEANGITSTAFNGNLMSQVDALFQLISKPFTTLWWAKIFIFLLFWTMETAPVLTKVLLPRGPYEVALEADDEVHMAKSDALKRWAKTQESAKLFQARHEAVFRYESAIDRVRRAAAFAHMLQDLCHTFQSNLVDSEAKLASKRSASFSDSEVMNAVGRIARQFWETVSNTQEELKSS